MRFDTCWHFFFFFTNFTALIERCFSYSLEWYSSENISKAVNEMNLQVKLCINCRIKYNTCFRFYFGIHFATTKPDNLHDLPRLYVNLS